MYLTPYSQIIDQELQDGRLGLLITPQSHRPEQYDVESFSYWAADNGCYTLGDRFDLDEFLSWLDSFSTEAKSRALFATAPDVVGDWDATLARSLPVLDQIRAAGFPAAIVIQNGATVETVPWDRIDAVFVGGDTEWKLGPESAAILAEAESRGIWTHMGRVNSIKRMKLAAEMGAWSVDGTLLIFGPSQNAPRIRKAVEQTYEIFGDVIVPDNWNRWAESSASDREESRHAQETQILTDPDQGQDETNDRLQDRIIHRSLREKRGGSMTRYTNVRRYKRGALWNDGETRTCTRCRVEKNRGERRRARQAVVTAVSNGTLPVAYCDEHEPDELDGRGRRA